MSYISYVDESYYLNIYKGSIPRAELPFRLKLSSRHVDSLTFNRISSSGIDSLTEFQKELIQEVVCLQADFEYENADLIDTVLSGYSLNGASVQFGDSWNIYTDKGVAIRKDIYNMLVQTGLCCRIVGY